MTTKFLLNVSDTEILNEYVKRFSLKAGDKISGSLDVANHLRSYFADDLHRESFVVVFLNGRNQVITTEKLFEGTLTSSAVYPREIIRKVIAHGAAAIVLGHNHPSGNPNPSSDDRQITRKIQQACNTIDVAVHDHIIIAGEKHTSFADQGLM